MFNQALQFLLETVLNFFLIAFLLRFYMQLLRAPFRNPFADFVVALTDFAVKPARRIIPSVSGLDMATLLLAWLLKFLLLLAVKWLGGFPFLVAGGTVWPAFALLAVVHLFKLSLYLLIGLVFVQALLSWFNPFSPLAPVISALSRPFVRPIQKILPPIGNVDLSPMVVFVICQLIIMLPVAWLETMVLRLI
jgi:YggT family protein